MTANVIARLAYVTVKTNKDKVLYPHLSAQYVELSYGILPVHFNVGHSCIRSFLIRIIVKVVNLDVKSDETFSFRRTNQVIFAVVSRNRGPGSWTVDSFYISLSPAENHFI